MSHNWTYFLKLREATFSTMGYDSIFTRFTLGSASVDGEGGLCTLLDSLFGAEDASALLSLGCGGL